MFILIAADQMDTAATANKMQDEKLQQLQTENQRLVQEIDLLNSKLNEALEMTVQSLNLTEIGRMRKDQDDLLELLTDQVKFIHKFFVYWES